MMSQRYLYPVLAIIVFLVSFKPALADNLLLNFTFDSAVRTSAWSDDGSILAVWTQTALYTIDMHSHELRELESYSIEEADAPFQILWSPDRAKIALISQMPGMSNTSMTVFNIEADLIVYSQTLGENPAFVSFSPDSRYLMKSFSRYIGGQAYESNIYIVDVVNNETLPDWRIGGYMGVSVYRFAWHPDSNQIAFQIGGAVHIYNFDTRTEITSFRVDADNFYDLDWNHDGTEIITYGYNVVRRWNAVTGQSILSFASGVDSSQANIEWLSDNTIVVTSATRVNAFDADTGNLLYYYELPESLTAYWSPLGRFAISAQENQIFIYAFEPIPASQQVAFEINIEANPRTSETDVMTGLAYWSPQGDILLTTATSITNLSQSIAPVYSIEVENAQLESSLFSNDGRIVALGLSDRDTSHYEIQVWDVQQNEMLHQFTGHRGLIYELEFNADNTLLASGSSDTTIRVWNLNTGEQVSEMWGHYGGIADIAFSPGSHLLASVADETMRIWDVQTGEQLNSVSPYSEYVIGGHYTFRVRFSPDGQYIIYHDHNNNDMLYGGTQVRVWDIETETQNYFHEQIHYLYDVIYSADGDFLALTNTYAEVKLFETRTKTGIELPYPQCAGLANPLEEGSEGHWMDFSPNSQLIAIVILNACLPAPIENPVTEDMFEFNTIWLVNIHTGTIQHILRGNESPSYRMFFSPDGTQLLTQHLDGTIKLWDVESGGQIPIAGL